MKGFYKNIRQKRIELNMTQTDLAKKVGVPINIASRLMGHANITITSKVYTHASVEALEIARALIDGQQRGQQSV